MGYGNWTETSTIAAPADRVFTALVDLLTRKRYRISHVDKLKRAVVAHGGLAGYHRFAARVDPDGDTLATLTLDSAPTYLPTPWPYWSRRRALRFIEWTKEAVA